jgi:hypothetical protein
MGRAVRNYIEDSKGKTHCNFLHGKKSVEFRRFPNHLVDCPIEDREQYYFETKEDIFKKINKDVRGLRQIWLLGENNILQEFKIFLGDENFEYLNPISFRKNSMLFEVVLNRRLMGGENMEFRELDLIVPEFLLQN